MITRKRFSWYTERLRGIKGIRLWKEQSDVERNYSYYPVIVEDDFGKSRDELYDELRKSNIYARKYFYPLTCEQQIYKNRFTEGEITVARDLSRRVLSLPFHAEISEDEMKRVMDVIQM